MTEDGKMELLACPDCEGHGLRMISEAGCCNNPTRTGECCGNAIEVQAEEQCVSCGGTGLAASLPDGSGQTKSADCGNKPEQSGQTLSRTTGDPSDVVGWKTFATGERDEDGFPKHRREPLTRAEGDAMWAAAEAAEADRLKRMPDEKAAISALFDAWQRLKDFKWNDPVYCPKDGSPFNVLELGSTGIHTAHYSGTWPDGHWWIADDHDLWPSRPALFKLLPEDQAKHDAKMQEGADRFRAAMASGEFDAPPEDVAETDASNRSESTPPAVLAAPHPPVEGLREALDEIWNLREIIRGVRIVANAGVLKDWEDEPWLKRVRNIDLDRAFASPSLTAGDQRATSDLDVHADVAEALTQACEYFENRADVNDGDYGVPEPNTEMRLAQMCSDALERIPTPATLIEQSGAALDLQGPGKADSEDRSTHEA